MRKRFYEEAADAIRNLIDTIFAGDDEPVLAEDDIEDGMEEDLEEERPADFKRMLYLPDGSVFFLTVEESDELLDACQEMGIIQLREGLMAVFDEESVGEYQGGRYVAGPVIIRTDMDPFFEADLTREEIRFVLDRLEANEESIRFGGVELPVLALR